MARGRVNNLNYKRIAILMGLVVLLGGCGSTSTAPKSVNDTDTIIGSVKENGNEEQLIEASSEIETTETEATETTETPIDEELGTYVTVSGTSLSFAPQGDFQPAGGFVGYESLTYETTILVLELPVSSGTMAVDDLNKVLTEEAIKSKGLEFISKKKMNSAWDNEALLLKMSMVNQGVNYDQWMYILESDGKLAGQIQVTAPSEKFAQIENEIYDMLLSFHWSIGEESEHNYSLDLPQDWKLAKQTESMEMYNKGGIYPPEQAGDPYIKVMTLQQAVEEHERQSFLNQMNLEQENYSELRVIKSNDMEIDGYPANISYVYGMNLEIDQPIIKQYCYIFLEESVVFMESDSSEIFAEAEFEEIANSWKLK